MQVVRVKTATSRQRREVPQRQEMHLAILRAADDVIALEGDGDTMNSGFGMIDGEALTPLYIPHTDRPILTS